LNAKEVGQITHSSTSIAEKSCDRKQLRVKSGSLFGCSIRLLKRRRSITELTTDPHSRQVSAEDHAPTQIETLPSCGLVSSAKTHRPLARFEQQASDHPGAGTIPALSSRARGRLLPGARRAEFISVSGQCAARSALSSVMRIKRITGGVAATEHLRAPMNSPMGFALRVSFSTWS
jgi:hypothetical protein